MLLQTIKPFIVVTAWLFVFSAAVFTQDEPQPLRRTVEIEEIESKTRQESDSRNCADANNNCNNQNETPKVKADRSQIPLSNTESRFAKTTRGIANYKKGDIEKALIDLEKGNQNAETSLYLGNIYLSKAKFKEAYIAFSRAIRLDPNVAQAYVGRGTVYLEQQNYEPAIEDFDRAVFINARLSKAYYGLGLCYLKFGEQLQQIKAEQWEISEAYNKAIKNFDSVEEIDLSKADPVIYFKRAKAYEALGFKERAANERQKFEESGKQP